MKFSELAKNLEPYLIKLINDIIGEQKYDTASNTGDMTYIHGTGFPTDDNSGARSTTYGVDLQLSGDDSSVNQGSYSSILGGNYNEIESGASYSSIIGGNENFIDGDYSGAMGTGAWVDKNHQLAIGSYASVVGDAQAGITALSHTTLTVSSSWQEIAAFDIRTDTTWTFRALIAGIRQGAAESFAYEVSGCVENDGGTTSLLASTVTTIYEDDVSYNCQATVDDPNDELVFQIIDSDNSGNTSRWHTTLITSEVSWAA